MKLTLFIFLIVLSISSFAKETMTSDKGVDIFSEIISRWSNLNSTTFETEKLGNTLLAGRCYNSYQKRPWGSAIVFEQRKVDNGPIGTPVDVISFGQMEWSDSADSFDLLNYANFKYLITAGSIKDNFSEFGSDSEQVGLKEYSIKYQDGTYYAVRYNLEGNGRKTFLYACYYFKNNN